MMILPYAGEKGCTRIKFLKKNLQRALPINIQTRIVCTGQHEEQHDIVYHFFYSAENCNENYFSESAPRLDERMKYQNGRDRSSHLFKHSVESRHDTVLKNDFRIIGKSYRNNTCRRKIAEVLFIKKKMKPLNIQEKSMKLELFN